MDQAAIEKELSKAFPEAKITVSGDGYHFEIIMISIDFVGLSRLKRQQKVYAIFQEAITSGALHALALKLFTPEEWQHHG